MTSLIQFNQVLIQDEEFMKYIFGSLSLREDHLQADVKFRGFIVVTNTSIIMRLLRVYWETGKGCISSFSSFKEIIVFLLSKVAISWESFDLFCLDPDRVSMAEGTLVPSSSSQSLLAHSWPLLPPSASDLSWPELLLIMQCSFHIKTVREETICLNCWTSNRCFVNSGEAILI